MSYTFNKYNNSTSTKLQKQREERNKAYKENKGNWEFTFFQKKHDPDQEAKIKITMKPSNGFNPANIHHYINPAPTREELICAKKERGEHLKSAEQIVYDNYISSRNNSIRDDYAAVSTQGINAKVTTIEGRTKRLLHTLDLMLKKADKEMVANIYLRLKENQFSLVPELAKEYSKQIKQMEAIVSKLNLIELQFTRFHSQMPPLNIHGFHKLDEWQVHVISNIDSNKSTIVNAFTSAGKSVLSGYVTTKGRALYVVPTDALAWQMSAYIGGIIEKNVPIITRTYQTNPSRDKMIDILNLSQAIVGTADSIVDYLPFMNTNFKWLVFDEIHMIGKPEGSAMEHIIKVVPNVPILALSATIGNTDEIVEWFRQISPSQPIEKVVCTKRFFNLQRFYYDSITDELKWLHPLALIDESQIADGSLLSKSLQPTPPNAWDLAMKLMNKYDIGNLNPNIYFSTISRIELTDAYNYFIELIKFIVLTYQTDSEGIMEIVNQYKHEALSSTSTNLIKLAFKLKSMDKTPAIFFQKNTLACLRMAREFAKNIEAIEDEKNPRLMQERLKAIKAAHRIEKKQKDDDGDSSKKISNSRKEMKQMLGGVKLKKAGYHDTHVVVSTTQHVEVTALQEPHPDFILNQQQYFTENVVEGWVRDLKKYFPNTGDYYHFLIKLLWRGVGVYAKGLPDPYLRLVQTLACQKHLGIVFSDQSLVFGVSMPFRTVVVVRDEKNEDDLDAMLFHQMSGRAGRRGLDKEGNVVFAGYSWARIKELSISDPPIVVGAANSIQTIPHGNKLSEIYKTSQSWENTCKNFLDKSYTDEDGIEFVEGIKSNYLDTWKFGFVPDDVNHLFMNWKLRYDEDCLISSLLLPYLNRAFIGKDHTQENNQVELAHFLCRFISTKETSNQTLALEDPEILKIEPYCTISYILEQCQIDIPMLIDNRIFMSIRQNSIIKSMSEDETDVLRHELLEFGEKIKNIQHYCFHKNIAGLSKILGKLLTRIWWIYHTSSPLMKPFGIYETEEFKDLNELNLTNTRENFDDEDYESNSENSDSENENIDEFEQKLEYEN
jgi:superfamily II DNA or RNA helicase